jgi:hypothetical protein
MDLRWPKSLYACVCLLLGAACGSETTRGSGASVCPQCERSALSTGTSGASASVAACSLAYLERRVDQAEAEKLGFPVAAATKQLEQPIDSAMEWVARESEGGGPAAGYERETRVHGQLKVESYKFHWIDPERCDGSKCQIDGQTVEQVPCPENYLMMYASGTFETLDGALSARFPTQAVNIRRPGQVDALGVAASVDLRDVTGSLTIDPGVPPPRVGRLDLSLQFKDNQRPGYGVLGVSVLPDWDNLPDGPQRAMIDARFARYAPIEAQWGEGVPLAAAASVSPAP